jgi:hypothetical protein
VKALDYVKVWGQMPKRARSYLDGVDLHRQDALNGIIDAAAQGTSD